MFTLYGMAAVLAARMSGPFADAIGARLVMLIGLSIWAFLEVIFLVFGVASLWEFRLIRLGSL
jgi:hypothetical protein